jgi:hypothetical protein
MLLRLPLVLFILLLSIVGCEQQDKETDTISSPPAEPTVVSPANTMKEATPSEKDANKTEAGTEEKSTDEPTGDTETTEPESNKEETTNDAH